MRAAARSRTNPRPAPPRSTSPPRTPSPPLTRRRRALFTIFLLLFPFLVLAGAEIVCRARGFGGAPPLFQRVGEENGRTWYATDRRGTDVFFTAGRTTTGGGMRQVQFAVPADPGTTRIVFLGESAVQGFPQPLPLTNGAFLEAILRDLWGDDRPVEVLNLGATAVASFPVLRACDEVLDLDPDLVVVMVGNNEFYGAYGMASVPALARSPGGLQWLYGLRRTGIVQAVRAALENRARRRGTLMERAAAGGAIGPDARMRTAAAKCLRAHLEGMARRCAARRVPLVLCTVPTNEADLAPIGVDLTPDLSASERAALQAALRDAEALLGTDPAGAAAAARTAVAQSSTPARAHFLLGRALAALGRPADALSEYVQARDLDTMPWRATSTVQEIVRDVAASAGSGVSLCDLESAFRAASPRGAIGWELMDDHVHLSLPGQFLFARALARTVIALPAPLQADAAALDALPGWEAFAARLGHSIYSDYTAASHIRKLFDIDFMKRNNAAALARFQARSDSLLARMSDAGRAAVARWHDPSIHGATERPLEWIAGLYTLDAGDWTSAATLLRTARVSVAPMSLWRLELTASLLDVERRLHGALTPEDQAIAREGVELGERLLRFGGAGNLRVQGFLGLVHSAAGDDAAAIARLEPVLRASGGPDPADVVAALAGAYTRTGRAEDARRLLASVASDPQLAARVERRMLPAVTPETAR